MKVTLLVPAWMAENYERIAMHCTGRLCDDGRTLVGIEARFQEDGGMLVTLEIGMIICRAEDFAPLQQAYGRRRDLRALTNIGYSPMYWN